MLSDSIVMSWEGTARGFANRITALDDTGYPAYTVKTEDGKYGVGISLTEGIEVYETFAGAELRDRMMTVDGVRGNYLLLLTNNESIKKPFAGLCAELVNPGNDGVFRKEIVSNPTAWWQQWKELLGNKAVDETLYDTLGELCVLKFCLQNRMNAIWTGPDGHTYDIDCENELYEVKSTTAREKREITLNNHFQLDPPAGKELFIVLCQFEAAQTGVCINGLVNDLIELGYNGFDLNEKLASKGFEKRKSSRYRCYNLNAMIKYKVDDSFPAIRESSFVGGMLPRCVKTISYTLSLDGVEGIKLIEQVRNEGQV